MENSVTVSGNTCSLGTVLDAFHTGPSPAFFTAIHHTSLSSSYSFAFWIELEIVNSCEKNNGRCSHHCERASGGPPCSCNHGHQPDSEEKTCIDLDECENGEACCAQLCINYLGEYECSCQEGFVISSDGCGCDALDDGELEGQKVLEVANFPGFLIQSPPRFLHYVATSLTPSYEDEEEEEEKDLQGLIVLPKVGGLRGSFGKNCKSKCNCANNGHCHRMYGTCVCEPGRCGKFCHLRCPKGVYGAGCSSECQCVEENTLECSAKNGSCTCKYGYQGNRCQKVICISLTNLVLSRWSSLMKYQQNVSSHREVRQRRH
ncbi:EGF-like and EMI domain-containing protein 1 [Fukomys damarensis]|uniref:EGF-like and EMI domain-containing protein 1 n=1 Tax=Fukomys damarensis TaxID=885580 RepID=A0A091CVE7_FUKDA|nr:EGF-like and EMI domain-containing protein 1 [Fukomys damarensis]